MTAERGLRWLLRSCRTTDRSSTADQLSSNSYFMESEVLSSSVEWLHSRVELLLSLEPHQVASPPESMPRFSVPRAPSSRRKSTVLPSIPIPSVVNKRKQRCFEMMYRLLKRLQSASRRPEKAAQLVSDDTLCRLLPMAICAIFTDLPPKCELLLARTLANLSSQQPSYLMFATDSFICNLVSTWANSPCLLLHLCGLKIASNMSTFDLICTLQPSNKRPYCIYQPDLYELARPVLAVPLMDVVFINGMLGSVFFTWKQGDDTAKEPTECWPKDWLAEDLPRARVLALNMKIAALKWRGCAAPRDPAGCLPRRANEALSQLMAAGVGHRLTAFVCHSFGGLIIKQLLQVLHNSGDPVRKKFLASIGGVIFVSVPHLGRSQAVNVNRIYWRPLRRMCLSDEASNVFDGSCRVLARLHAWFVQYAQTRNDLRVLNLIELDRTPIVSRTLSLKVCPETWADKLVGDVVRIATDHILICKPPNRDHVSYTSVRDFLIGLSSLSNGWRPTLLCGGHAASDWLRPLRNVEEELRLRYGVSSARVLWTSTAWHEFGARHRPRFYDML